MPLPTRAVGIDSRHRLIVYRLAGGMIPFMRRYSTICP